MSMDKDKPWGRCRLQGPQPWAGETTVNWQPGRHRSRGKPRPRARGWQGSGSLRARSGGERKWARGFRSDIRGDSVWQLGGRMLKRGAVRGAGGGFECSLLGHGHDYVYQRTMGRELDLCLVPAFSLEQS